MKVTSEGLGKGSTFIVELPGVAWDLFSPWENRVLSQAAMATPSLPHIRDSVSSFESPSGGDRAGVDELGELLHGGHFSSIGLTRYGLHKADSTTNSTEAASNYKSKVTPNSDKNRSYFTHNLTLGGSGDSDSNCGSAVSKEKLRRVIRKVLVVDDVSSNLKMMARVLKRGGVEVCIQATNGQEAVDIYAAELERSRLAQVTENKLCIMEMGEAEVTEVSGYGSSEPFDAILMDFEMPVMNGPTATARLREMGCRCLIVGVTGNVLPADVTLYKEHGANAVLTKPLRLEDLESVLRE